MTKLHLGVVDIPYGDANDKASTGEVAQILEDHYGVMEGFVYRHSKRIADELAQSMTDAIESIQLGAPLTIDPYGAATSAIESEFRDFLDREEIDMVAPISRTGFALWSVPTRAALMGKSKRFKRNRGPRRPSFIDSGLYQTSFRAWVETDK